MAISSLQLPQALQLIELANEQKLAKQLAASVAEVLQQAIAERGTASLVVSGGRTPLNFFKQLAQHELNWAQVVVSLADERWVPVGHADSNEGLVRRHLLQGPAAKARFIGLYHSAATVDECALAADQALAQLPQPIDALVLGMGEDGHTASLFPASPNLAEALLPDAQRRCLALRAPTVPHQRLSLTLAVLGKARSTFLLLQGSSKLSTLREAVAAGDVPLMPIRAFFNSPLNIYWCP
ncbi:6-phosphogluconolactonase [Pseudomonas sp. 5P_3.1_Bac2]|uniref:6-phosphogluconolactonase n=1 Tax=Pseudomonas sp. 5P_3.1_Bac2 TaxID=2971617 RepID=UPI0021C9884C|nr:6-phosphogluconolactonase [Pseudomonas sp. 5P_3.1_Bac2]MCU1717215.1 6-phosphogluconolactonase [Pseudomonas sp. 5P_3.1_Bac2]